MQATYATLPTPGKQNEDYVVAAPDWAAVFDGATPPSGVDSGCGHGVPWLVRQLAAETAQRMPRNDTPLPDLLADAIRATCAAHQHTCDLTNPSSPSTTVTVVRFTGDQLEYLVLADSPLVLHTDDGVTAVVDDRVDRLPSYAVEAVARRRNQPDGFWVASTTAWAAYEALHGHVPVAELRRVALLTDGASRYVQRFQLGDWASLLDLLEESGPAHLLQRVRAAEAGETPQQRQERRGKAHDDATAVFLKFR